MYITWHHEDSRQQISKILICISPSWADEDSPERFLVQVPSSVGKWNLHFHERRQQKEAGSALTFLDSWLFWDNKTQWTDTRRWFNFPNHYWLWKPNVGPLGFFFLSFPQSWMDFASTICSRLQLALLLVYLFLPLNFLLISLDTAIC